MGRRTCVRFRSHIVSKEGTDRLHGEKPRLNQAYQVVRVRFRENFCAACLATIFPFLHRLSLTWFLRFMLSEIIDYSGRPMI